MREIRSIAHKLRMLRASRSMSVEQLSDITGLSKRTINRAEAADLVGYNPQMKTVGSLCRAFNIDLGTMLTTPATGIVAASQRRA